LKQNSHLYKDELFLFLKYVSFWEEYKTKIVFHCDMELFTMFIHPV